METRLVAKFTKLINNWTCRDAESVTVSVITHELFIYDASWCPKIPLRIILKSFLDVWTRENSKPSKNSSSLHVCILRHICFEGKWYSVSLGQISKLGRSCKLGSRPVVTRYKWILQNQVSARRLELNKIIFRQIAPTLYDLVGVGGLSIQRLKRLRWEWLLQNMDQSLHRG